MDTSLEGKTYVVTGATSGIGLEAARQLVSRGAFVIGVGRSAERCAQAETSLKASALQARVRYCVADLSLQANIRRLAEEVRGLLSQEKPPSLDGLINDAGTFTYYMTLTAEGFEMQWAVNHLAAFLLTHELLPLLKAAPQARVVTVSSGNHKHATLRWEDIQLRRRYFGLTAYGQTKLCNILFTAELNRLLGEGSSVHAFAANPGLVSTSIGAKGSPALVRWLWNLNVRSRKSIPAEESAKGVVFLATEPSIQDSTQVYWKHSQPQAPDPYALDPLVAKRLWGISEQMVGLAPGTYLGKA